MNFGSSQAPLFDCLVRVLSFTFSTICLPFHIVIHSTEYIVNQILVGLHHLNRRIYHSTARRKAAQARRLESAAYQSRVPEWANKTQFSSLPVEIRLQIWRLAFPGSRVIVLGDGGHRPLYRFQQQFWTPTSYRALQPLPVTLSVCRESRAETLKIYQLGFSRDGYPPRVYMDFELDILFWPYVSAMYPDVRRVRRIGMHVKIAAYVVDRMDIIERWDELILIKDTLVIRSANPETANVVRSEAQVIGVEQLWVVPENEVLPDEQGLPRPRVVEMLEQLRRMGERGPKKITFAAAVRTDL
jgi:hypothetical protein